MDQISGIQSFFYNVGNLGRSCWDVNASTAVNPWRPHGTQGRSKLGKSVVGVVGLVGPWSAWSGQRIGFTWNSWQRIDVGLSGYI